jgi:hypothetical protein
MNDPSRLRRKCQRHGEDYYAVYRFGVLAVYVGVLQPPAAMGPLLQHTPNHTKLCVDSGVTFDGRKPDTLRGDRQREDHLLECASISLPHLLHDRWI